MNDYSIDEIVEQIEDEFGFISKIQENGDTFIISILIDAITKINLVISLEDTDTGYAIREYHLDFPDKYASKAHFPIWSTSSDRGASAAPDGKGLC